MACLDNRRASHKLLPKSERLMAVGMGELQTNIHVGYVDHRVERDEYKRGTSLLLDLGMRLKVMQEQQIIQRCET
jgi:hypothetical protein